MSGPSIADSSAVLEPTRVFSQHHAAITLLTTIIANRTPGTPINWLDLACGKGQIIANFEEAVPDCEARSRIHYFGYDIENEYTRDADKKAATLKFASTRVMVGQLDHFVKLVDTTQAFNFITFTNTVHELPPQLFGALLLALMARMEPDATLYICDMENLPDPELGATLWSAPDVRRLLASVFKEAGGTRQPPMVQRWVQSKCAVWSVTLQRNMLDVDTKTFATKLPELEAMTKVFIQGLFEEKLSETIVALEALTTHGGQTKEEQKDKVDKLFQFWSLSRHR